MVEENTIGKHFDMNRQTSSHSLEDKLFSISMGEYIYNPAYDNRYKYWPQLFRHCWGWAEKFGAGPYVPYKTEADMMSHGMQELARVDKQRPLPAWMAAIRRLRDLQYGRQTANAR